MNDHSTGFCIDDYLPQEIVGATGAGVTTFATETDTVLQNIDAILKDYELTHFAQKLASYVEERFFEARRARQADGVDTEIDKAVNAYLSRYNPEDAEMVAQTADVYAPITNTKCRGLQNWIMDILANAEDKPWTLTPSPEPELPEWMQQEIVKRLEAEAMTNGVSSDMIEQVRAYKELAKKHATTIAAEKTKNMEDRIYDQMLKSDWRAQFRQFVDDLSYMPAAILHGPTVEMRTEMHWSNGRVVEQNVPTYVLRRVNPPDFYPSPGATSTQDAAYLCEVRPFTAEQLLGSMALFGVDQSAIRKLLAMNPDGYTLSENRPGAPRPSGITSTSGPARIYETIQYVGAVDGEVLLAHGMTDVDPQGVEEMDIWVCNGIVLRALRSPYPLKQRPYHSTAFLRQAGRFWGRALPSLIDTVQRMANAATRSIARDMAFSSGPIGEYDVERLVGETKIEQFNPYRLYAVKPDYTSGGANAIRFQRIASNSAALMGIYDRYVKEADDVSGIPAYVIGNPNVAGAGRTLGGLSLLMGNAAKGVKRVISDIDKDVIEPIVTMFYRLNLLYSPDDTIKADASVVARGASGLLQRELSQSRAAEVLPLLTQGMSFGLVEPMSIAKVMRDMLVSLGYDPDLVVDPDRQMQIMALMQQAGAPPSGTSTATAGPNSGLSQPVLPPAAPPAQLDGRSTPPADPSAAERL